MDREKKETERGAVNIKIRQLVGSYSTPELGNAQWTFTTFFCIRYSLFRYFNASFRNRYFSEVALAPDSRSQTRSATRFGTGSEPDLDADPFPNICCQIRPKRSGSNTLKLNISVEKGATGAASRHGFTKMRRLLLALE
jgi:hypothetical protein